MILVDTSVWIDYFRSGDGTLAAELERGSVLQHPWVLGELALGSLHPTSEALALMSELPAAVVATEAEVFTLITAESLAGSGVGYMDAQLIASARLTNDTVVWTHDKRLLAVTDRLGIAYQKGR